MPSKIETILAAIQSAINASTTATVERATALTVEVPPEGRIVLIDGQLEDMETTMSPLTYHVEHVAALEVYVGDDGGKDAGFDALKLQIASALAADRTLGGLCDWVEGETPDTSNLALDGSAEMKSGIIPIRIFYATNDPLT